jgi:hypothetical protein
MADDLAEIIGRINYCDGETNTLYAEIEAYFAQASEFQTVAESSHRTVLMRLNEPPPLSIKVRAGLVVHELRSCLDSLACQLAVRNQKSTNGVYFPISKTAAVFADDGMKKIQKLASPDQAKIVAMAPHGDGDPFLFGMHEFDRTRKHIRLNATNTGNMGFGVKYAEKLHIIRVIGQTNLDTEWRPVCEVSLDSEAYMEFPGSIMIEEPNQLKGHNVVRAIKLFADQTRSIVSQFA